MVWNVLEKEPVNVLSRIHPQRWGRLGSPHTVLSYLSRLNVSVLVQGKSWGLF